MSEPSSENPPFGVKMTSGKVIWIDADDVKSKGGALLFTRGGEVVAGFNVNKVDHFGLRDAFVDID